MKQVKILCQVVTAQYGTLSEGAILRTDDAFAKHLVHECGAAEYDTVKVEQPPSQVKERTRSKAAAKALAPPTQQADVNPPLAAIAATDAAASSLSAPANTPTDESADVCTDAQSGDVPDAN